MNNDFNVKTSLSATYWDAVHDDDDDVHDDDEDDDAECLHECAHARCMCS